MQHEHASMTRSQRNMSFHYGIPQTCGTWVVDLGNELSMAPEIYSTCYIPHRAIFVCFKYLVGPCNIVILVFLLAIWMGQHFVWIICLVPISPWQSALRTRKNDSGINFVTSTLSIQASNKLRTRWVSSLLPYYLNITLCAKLYASIL